MSNKKVLRRNSAPYLPRAGYVRITVMYPIWCLMVFGFVKTAVVANKWSACAGDRGSPECIKR